MSNRDTEAAWRYHESTKHSYGSVRSGGHVLDWENQPRPFKLYRGLDPIPLPRELRGTGVSALDAVSRIELVPAADVSPDLTDLAQVLYLSAGITRRKVYPSGEVVFRAASCTGALYEIDVYLACGELDGLSAGVYHYDPRNHALSRLRAGDHRACLVRASGDEPSVARAPVVLVCTASYWRNAWKYRSRSYRHFGWDNGTLLANTLAASAGLGLPARVVMGFVDDVVNDLLALDARREVAFSLVSLGRVTAPPPDGPAPGPLVLEEVPYSSTEIDYPLMRDTHSESRLLTTEQAAGWRGHAPRSVVPPLAGAITTLVAAADEELPGDSIEEVILRRGSTRRFDRRAALGLDQLSTLLDRSTRGVPADFLEPPGALLNHAYLIVHAVDGLTPGAYVLHRAPGRLEQLKQGDFRGAAGYLGLEQALPADASAVVFFLADLDVVLRRFGSRGYRAVQLEAGILGGKMYLSAYAQRFGASGLTFYDDDVVRFFSPHAQGKSAVFVMTLGRSAKVVPVGRAEPASEVHFGRSDPGQRSR